jgi:hypothetical protein
MDLSTNETHDFKLYFPHDRSMTFRTSVLSTCSIASIYTYIYVYIDKSYDVQTDVVAIDRGHGLASHIAVHPRVMSVG